MTDNTFWTCFWACATIMAVAFSTTVHLSNINTTKAQLEEHKAAISAGLQQQLIGHEKIWVKIDKDK